MNEKIKATTITVVRAEGPSELCGIPQTFEGPECWDDATSWLRNQSETFPAWGGYDKHDFVVTFADGETWEGRLDCKHYTCTEPDLNVAAHVRDFARFSAGLQRPEHMDEETYRAWVESRPKAKVKMWTFLQNYDLGGLS